MNKIYCVYCGTKNDINAKVCSKCKKELNPKDHLVKDYLFNHVKDDLKGKVKDNIFSLLTNYFKSHLYGTIITMALVFSATAGVVNVVNNSRKEVESKSDITIKKEALDINSDLVKELYSFNMINSELITEEDFYQNKLVTYNVLSDATKFDLVYRSLSDGSAKRDTSTCEFLKGYSLYEGCLDDPDYILDYYYSSINKKDLENKWHKLYGSNTLLPLKKFIVNQVQECEYSQDNDDYLCYMGMVGGYGVPERYTKIIKAEKYGNNIIIYDKYILFSFTDDATFADPDETIKIGNEWEKNLIDKGSTYKHIFRKDTNDSYYWVSSEPVEIKE